MAWSEEPFDNINYTTIPLDNFTAKYPGVIDSEIAILTRMQSLFKVYEDASFSVTLPKDTAYRIDKIKRLFIEELLVPLEHYNPREALSFGGLYSTSDYVNKVQEHFVRAYTELAPMAAFLKAELFDYGLIKNYPGKDIAYIIEQFEEMKKKSKSLPGVMKKIDEAEKAADEWTKKQNIVLERLIETKSRELDMEAKRHQGSVQLVWASLAVISGFVAYYLGSDILNAVKLQPSTQVTLGFALLKFSSIFAPLVAAYICFNQYSYHRSMSDALKFRAIALSNLATLSKQYPDSKNVIFEKGIDLIFDEPKSKASQVKFRDIKDLISLVKNK